MQSPSMIIANIAMIMIVMVNGLNMDMEIAWRIMNSWKRNLM